MLERPLVLRGRCACGRVEFTVHARDTTASVCYCATCRRASGGAGIAWVSADAASLRQNGSCSRWRDEHCERSFCVACGSQLFAQDHPARGSFEVCLGSLEDDSFVVATRSVCAETRRPWDAAHTLHEHVVIDEPQRLGRPEPMSESGTTQACLASLMASAPDAFVTIDPQGLVADWSSRAQETFGWTYAEAIRQPLHELIIPPELRAAHLRGLSRLQLTGHGPVLGKRFEVQAQRKDGARIPVELSVAPMRTHAGMGASAFLKDLRPALVAQAGLQAATALLQRTGELALVGGWSLDVAARRLSWSAVAKQIHGVGADFEPAVGHLARFYSPESLSWLRAAVRRGMRQGRRWELALPLLTAQGSHRWIRTIGDTEFDEAGHVIRVVGAVQDITDHKRLETELVAAEQFMRKITDNLPVRIGYLDPLGRYQFANRANCQRLGATREQVLGRTRVELLGEGENATGAQHLQAALEGERRRFEQSEWVGGRLVYTESQLIPDLDQGGLVQGIFTIGVDITERKSAEESLRVLAQIFDATPDYVVQADRQGRVTYMNPAVRRAAGLAANADITRYSFLDFNTPETPRRYRTEIIPEVVAAGVWLGETTVVVASGVIPVNHMVLAHRDAAGQVVRYSSVMRDISQVAKARAQLYRQRRTLSSVAEAIPTFIAVVDNQARYEFVNTAFEELLGRSSDDIVGQRLGDVLGAAEVSLRLPAIEQALQGVGSSFELDMFLGGAQRNLVVTLKPRRSEDGEPDGFVAIMDDVTLHKQRESRLVKLSEQDALTGLANRQGLESFLRSIPATQIPGTGLLYVDLDRFKAVNDTHGHPAGDLLLKTFAARVAALVRPTDLVARLGGDEFAVVLTGLPGPEPVQTTAQKVVDCAAQPFDLHGVQVRIGASVGVAMAGGDGWEGLIQRADAGVYSAKAAGRGRYR